MTLMVDYRPKNLDEIIGNESIVGSLKAIFDREKDWPHSYLFSGPSGCGKTTLGRIVKDRLGCLGTDYVEINASSTRGIDAVRNIIDNMKYKPQTPGSKSRVFLLDECHMLTGDAANALLKALEEPPAHVYFILCTTDPEKLIKTIRNRCAQFEVQSLGERGIVKLLNWVLEKENVNDIPENIIKLIAKVSDGCPRQALVILDQIIDMPLDKMEASVQDFRSSEKNTLDLFKALLSGQKWVQIKTILQSMDLANHESVRVGLIGLCASTVMREDNLMAGLIFEEFKNPLFNAGKNGFIMTCYKLCNMCSG